MPTNVVCCGIGFNLRGKKIKKETAVLEVKPTALSCHTTLRILFFNG
jgi:hypothetical protein